MDRTPTRTPPATPPRPSLRTLPRPPRALARPLVRLLSSSTHLVVRLSGGEAAGFRPLIDHRELTAERMRTLVAENTRLTADERTLIGEVLAAGERPLREVLVPRTEVEFLDAELPVPAAARTAARSPHSRFPVCRGSHDEVVGFVHIRDLLVPDPPEAPAGDVPVADLVRPVKFLPSTKRVLPALSEMRREGCHLAIVMDEYGGVAGIVTLEDLVEELIGDIRDEYDVQDAQARRLHGGVVEVDGLLNLDDFAAETGIRLPAGPYETVAGHIMAALRRVPAEGDSVEAGGRRLAVARMDGRRVARVRVMPRATPQAVPSPPGAPPATPRAVPGDAAAGPAGGRAATGPAADRATGGGASGDT